MAKRTCSSGVVRAVFVYIVASCVCVTVGMAGKRRHITSHVTFFFIKFYFLRLSLLFLQTAVCSARSLSISAAFATLFPPLSFPHSNACSVSLRAEVSFFAITDS